MADTLKNDLYEGNRNIIKMASILELPLRAKLSSQIMYQYVYPKLFQRENYNDISFITIYVASKTEEIHVKMETLVKAATGIKNTKPEDYTESFVKCESMIIDILRFNFEIRHVHFIFIKLCRSIGIEPDKMISRLEILDEIHGDDRVNKINYFGDGKYEPEDVGVSLLTLEELGSFERKYFIEVNRDLRNQIRNDLFENITLE
ncbi:hypothetical protein TCON_0733 [Astathelohania contejeani]|uniref:Cyclin n=1 Tax=Astathelohania contejeani TaxID=164912 RepID=A0ABQ7I122_9MICR|nr:hypothetical protein TCON_0733 [Thelohania contejeani]